MPVQGGVWPREKGARKRWQVKRFLSSFSGLLLLIKGVDAEKGRGPKRVR